MSQQTGADGLQTNGAREGDHLTQEHGIKEENRGAAILDTRFCSSLAGPGWSRTPASVLPNGNTCQSQANSVDSLNRHWDYEQKSLLQTFRLAAVPV